MRPAGRAQYDSLYFDYPTFEYRRPPELDGIGQTHDVAIVGAGPVGLVAALELARHGVRSVVLDDKTTVNDGSRALCLARHSMEQLQQLGVAETFSEAALAWTGGRSYFRDQQVYQLQMPDSENERFRPMYNLQQQYIELYLVQAARRSEWIDLRFGHAVEDVEIEPDAAQLQIKTPDGGYALQARYVLAADGARSTVRKALGLEMAGDAYEGRYVIADIQMQSDYPTERRAFFDASANPGATILIHKQPHGIWRVDWQLQPGDDEAAALEETALRERIAAILEMVGETGPWALEWWSVYSAFTLCLEDYRCGPVFFLGDAAHLVPIFGVRGLNSGLADAGNIGWKLAAVLAGGAPDALLDSYTPERRGATMDVFANARKSTQFMTPPTPGYRIMRDAALSLSLRHEFARPFLNPRQSTPYDYSDSALTSADDTASGFNAGPRPGAPLANHRLDDGSFLLDHLPRGFTLLVFGAKPAHAALRLQAAVCDERGVRLSVLAVIGETGVDAHDAIAIHDPGGALRRSYGARDGTCYLVRPDRHVAARWHDVSLRPLDRALACALGRPA